MNRGIDLNHRVERIQRLSCNVAEVELEGAQI